MIKITITNDETGLTLERKYDNLFFSTNDREKMGEVMWDMYEMVSVEEDNSNIPF